MREHQLLEIVNVYREMRAMAMTTARELCAYGMDSAAVFVTRARECNRIVVHARQRLTALRLPNAQVAA